MRFDCACQKGHRFTVFAEAPPEVCTEWRWEHGPDSWVHRSPFGSIIENPIPVQCGALVVVEPPRAGEAA